MKRILAATALFAIVASSGSEASMQRKPKQQRQDPEHRERPSSGARSEKSARPFPATPCCDITAIDAAAGIVTARNATTGETFQFEVESRSLLRSLQVGQKVYADMEAKKAGVKPAVHCCNITNRQQRMKE